MSKKPETSVEGWMVAPGVFRLATGATVGVPAWVEGIVVHDGCYYLMEGDEDD